MQHILIVEDEQHLAIGIKYNLEAEGYMVSTVDDGPSALKMFEQQPPNIDLLILDLMLPGMSGYAVCETLREQGHELPILMLSARTLTEDRIRGFDVGTDLYLQKPFDLDELISIVRNMLSRRTRSPARVAQSPDDGDEDVFSFGRAVINFDTYQVTVGDEPVKLTNLEMKLLRHFIDNEGSVVTRQELLEQVWGVTHAPTTRTVDNFIVNLRKYFEIDPAQPRHFLSVRGVGYRFVAAGEAGV